MARFNFGKRNHDDEGVPPEPLEGETDAGFPSEALERGSRMRRPLIIAGIGVVVVGCLYLANVLFFSAPPPPPIPVRPAVPAPAAPLPAAPAQTKEPAASPVPPPAGPIKPEAKAEAKTPAPPSAPAQAETPAKIVPPAKARPATKSAPAPTTPAKSSTPPPKPEAKPPVKGVAPAAKGFSVQVGAMAQQANAEALKQRLDAMGYEAVVRKGSGFASSHIVTVGDFTGKREAEETARRLNVDGFPSQLAAAEGKFVPQIGSFVNLDEAIDVARELQKKNYRPKITSKPAATVLFQVRHGQFGTREAAIKRGEELKAKGLSAWVVPN